MNIYKITVKDDEETLDEVYTIPEDKLPKLNAVITRLKNKGAPVHFEEIEKVEIPVYPAQNHIVGGAPVGYVFGVKIKVNGSFKINDYELVAKINHEKDDEGNPANIITRVGSENIPIPEEYFEAAPECDYCHIKRFRNATFILYNKNEDKYIHVGGECLKYFTNGLDAATAASFLDTLSIIKDLDINPAGVGEDDLISKGIKYNKQNSFILKDIVNISYDVITKEKEYIKGRSEYSTAYKVFEVYAQNKNSYSSIFDEFKNYVELQKKSNNEYWTNVMNLINKEYVEDKYLGYIISAVYLFWKNQEKKLSNKVDDYLGNVGDKVEFVIQQCDVLWKSDNSSYSYYAKPSYMYKIVTTTGNVVMWSTSADLEEGMKIRATIKQLKEFRGEKETIVTRGKII